MGRRVNYLSWWCLGCRLVNGASSPVRDGTDANNSMFANQIGGVNFSLTGLISEETLQSAPSLEGAMKRKEGMPARTDEAECVALFSRARSRQG